jgi:hypothetical protein
MVTQLTARADGRAAAAELTNRPRVIDQAE